MKITVLGCGASTGVPHPIYKWGNCDPKNAKNNRTRSSILLEIRDFCILIDTSPDLRTQLLRLEKMPYIDAIFYTHAHFDHVFGIGDLRPIFYSRKDLVHVYARKSVLDYVKQIAEFMFFNPSQEEIYKPTLYAEEIQGDSFKIDKESDSIEITCVDMKHGILNCTGFRIDNFAYATDVSGLSLQSLNKLRNLDVLIIDCLSFERESKAHMNLKQTLQLVENIKPKKTYLTHMDFSMDYDTLVHMLPDTIRPAYDGLTIES